MVGGDGTASQSSREVSISESPVASGSRSAVTGSSGKGKEPANGKAKGIKGFKSQRPSFRYVTSSWKDDKLACCFRSRADFGVDVLVLVRG